MTIPHEFNRGFLSPNAQGRYRAVSNEPPVTLIRKRCACNAIVTALQLTRYGRCEKCVRAA